MRQFKLTEWIAVAAALVVVAIFVFPSFFSSVFFPANATPKIDTSGLGNVPSSTSTPSINMQNISTIPGLSVYDVSVGTGAAAASGNQVSVNYTGTLSNGTIFDSNTNQKFGHVQPFDFTLGAGQVIKGWDQGLVGMKVGGVREIVISPALGYGANQVGPIPPNSTLTFQVELLSVK
jgi:peptidylprolyl isomerase